MCILDTTDNRFVTVLKKNLSLFQHWLLYIKLYQSCQMTRPWLSDITLRMIERHLHPNFCLIQYGIIIQLTSAHSHQQGQLKSAQYLDIKIYD